MSNIEEKEALAKTETAASRRTFLTLFAGAAMTGLALPLVDKPAPSPQAETGLPPLTGASDLAVDEGPIRRMMADLHRALAKPVDQRHWVMVIDLRKCVGCHSCTIACISENRLPPGVVYRQVIEEEIGTYPHVAMRFTPRPCQHCSNPPCVSVCPVGATYQRADGIVAMDYDRCIGCRYCINACPYSARTFDFGYQQSDGAPNGGDGLVGNGDAAAVEALPMFEYGEARVRNGEQSPVGNVRKCHFCLHRLEKGMLPACTTACIGRATYFGDANDPDSLVSELMTRPNVMQLREELGTEPGVFYLV